MLSLGTAVGTKSGGRTAGKQAAAACEVRSKGGAGRRLLAAGKRQQIWASRVFAGRQHQHPQRMEVAAGSVLSRAHWVDARSASAATSVHYDPENLQLFRTAATRVAESVAKHAASSQREPSELRVLDLGSGSGVWGLVVASQLRHTVGLEEHSIRLVFADITQASIDLSLANAARSCGTLSPAHALAFACEGFVGDMFDAVSCNATTSDGRERLKDQRPFDVILFNPPQTGGHDAFRGSSHALEKYGGDDGSLYYRRFAREVGPLAHDATACVLAQIGLANPARVQRTLRSAGFDSVTELARQQRTTTVRRHALIPGAIACLFIRGGSSLILHMIWIFRCRAGGSMGIACAWANGASTRATRGRQGRFLAEPRGRTVGSRATHGGGCSGRDVATGAAHEST